MARNLFILIFICLSVSIYSQTKPCDIKFFKEGGVYNSRILGQYKDMILVSDTGTYKVVDIVKVKSITFNNGNHKWTGAGIGAATGFITGMVLYAKFNKKDKPFITRDPVLAISMLFTLPAAVIGGLVGSFFKNLDFYDLTDMGSYMKAKEIKYIRYHHYNWR